MWLRDPTMWRTGGLTGVGTPGRVPKWLTVGSLGDSVIADRRRESRHRADRQHLLAAGLELHLPRRSVPDQRRRDQQQVPRGLRRRALDRDVGRPANDGDDRRALPGGPDHHADARPGGRDRQPDDDLRQTQHLQHRRRRAHLRLDADHGIGRQVRGAAHRRQRLPRPATGRRLRLPRVPQPRRVRPECVVRRRRNLRPGRARLRLDRCLLGPGRQQRRLRARDRRERPRRGGEQRVLRQ